MTPSNDARRDTIVPLDYAQQALMDGLDAVRRPDAHAITLLDLSAAHAFREKYKRERGVALTDLHLIIRAVARTLEADDPQHASPLNSILTGNKIIKPPGVDVGVSVVTRRSVAPVVVIPEAQDKLLPQIREELKTKAAAAEAKEKSQFANFNRYARWLPSRAARRQLVRFALQRHQVRRAMLGTVQITTIDLQDVEFYLPTHIGTSMLISVGGVRERPMVINGRIEARACAYVAFQVDQRIVNAVSALRVCRRFHRWMAHPERLDADTRDK